MKRFYIILITILTFGVLTSCTEDYYFETGIANDKFNGSAWDYLNSKPEHFSKITEIIKVANMESIFQNDEITFFAPKNPSIERAMNKINSSLKISGLDTIANFNEVNPEIWQEFVGLYVIPGRYELKDIPQVDTLTFNFKGQQYKSINGRSMNMGLLYNSAGGVDYAGYRQIIYAYVYDFARPEASRSNIIVATANNKVNNGVVHVLQATAHTFGFDTNVIIERLRTGGFISQ